ncbi:MAG: thioredoxin family protein, partial [Pseudomonadota bacterium]
AALNRNSVWDRVIMVFAVSGHSIPNFFLAVLLIMLFAVGLNLSGVFQIGTSLTRLGGSGPQDGVSGSFATGVLATIVATPCSAPFMAVAVGTALAASELTALAIFAAMGLGLAAPFVALTLMPGLAKALPKPGVWMERLKQALAFLLYATAVWLVWVLAQLVGIEAMLGALVALVLVALAAWLFGLSQRGGGRSHKISGALAVLALLAAGFSAWPSLTGTPPRAIAMAAAGSSEAYSPGRLAALRQNEDAVFLNVTAAWCISCKVNERVVFETEDFRALLAEEDITYVTADWTRRDPDVSALLEGFGRAGVPLYVYYPAGGAPKVLPQILTLSMLENAFTAN